MTIDFYKYQGTGNDFVMIDDRDRSFPEKDKVLVAHMCDRRYGIGADGLILLQDADGYDFKMVYFNSDGSESTMCGNGGRCLVSFAKHIGVTEGACTFLAIDGPHKGKVLSDDLISLKMNDVKSKENRGGAIIMDTGSPHYVTIREEVGLIDIKAEGAAIRYSDDWKDEGINVNFISLEDDLLTVATYERGVEDETFSCGTGVVASSLAVSDRSKSPQRVKTKGGELMVSYEQNGGIYENIWLTGPARLVFRGAISLTQS